MLIIYKWENSDLTAEKPGRQNLKWMVKINIPSNGTNIDIICLLIIIDWKGYNITSTVFLPKMPSDVKRQVNPSWGIFCEKKKLFCNSSKIPRSWKTETKKTSRLTRLKCSVWSCIGFWTKKLYLSFVVKDVRGATEIIQWLCERCV